MVVMKRFEQFEDRLDKRVNQSAYEFSRIKLDCYTDFNTDFSDLYS